MSSHSFLGPDACLACLYLPTQKSKNEDQIVAEGLKVPQFQDQVRILLGSGQATGKKICDAVATAWGIPAKTLAPYVDKPIRELWVDGICGGGIIPLGEAGHTPRELQVPLAFQSALAGMLLAAETACDVLTFGAQRKTLVRRMDVLRPLGNPSPQPALKAGTGSCVCEDHDFIATYRTKYEAEGPCPRNWSMVNERSPAASPPREGPVGRSKNEKQTTQRRTNHRHLEASSGRRQDGRDLPPTRHQRANLLPLESQYGGLELSEAKKLRRLEEENRQLKQLVGELSLDKRALQDVLSKNF